MTDAPDLFAPVTDVNSLTIGRLYAQALYNAAEAANKSREVADELAGVAAALRAAPGLEAQIGHLGHQRGVGEKVLHDAFHGRVGDLLFDFLRVLTRHRRADLITAVARAYSNILDREQRRSRVSVRSAVPLTDDQKAKLRDEVAGLIVPRPAEVVLETRVDPELLGGLVVQVGDRVFDNSVRSRLDNIRDQLLARSSHEIRRQRDRVGPDS